MFVLHLKNLPTPVLFVGMIVFFIVVAVGGVLIIRPVLLRRLGKEHPVLSGIDGGVKVAEVATALLIGMVVVQSLTNFLDAKQAVYQESAALGVVYRDAMAIKGPEGERLRTDIADYNAYILKVWPQIQQGNGPTDNITDKLTRIQSDFDDVHVSPDTAQAYELRQIVTDFNSYVQLRQQRASGTGGMEPKLYLLLLISIVIMFLGVWVSVGGSRGAQLATATIAGLMVGVFMWSIVALDIPAMGRTGLPALGFDSNAKVLMARGR